MDAVLVLYFLSRCGHKSKSL